MLVSWKWLTTVLLLTNAREIDLNHEFKVRSAKLPCRGLPYLEINLEREIGS